MEHSASYSRIKSLHDAGKLNAAGVQNAVVKGLITQDEANEILGIIPE